MEKAVCSLCYCLCLLIASSPLLGQQSSPELQVNWLYGAYLPKGVPRESLNGKQRRKLYLRQTFTTPGIYVKTLMFSVGDQLSESPPGWGNDFGGYARRVASRQGQFVLQNSFVAWGNWKLGYEPRFDRCRCSGFWPRTRHAIVRNFITYDRSEKSYRPQIALYAGAFTSGVVAGTWKPKPHNLFAEGYRAAFTQAGFGIAANWLGEFAPDILHLVLRRKESAGEKF